jgi:hypothetical protein
LLLLQAAAAAAESKQHEVWIFSVDIFFCFRFSYVGFFSVASFLLLLDQLYESNQN